MSRCNLKSQLGVYGGRRVAWCVPGAITSPGRMSAAGMTVPVALAVAWRRGPGFAAQAEVLSTLTAQQVHQLGRLIRKSLGGTVNSGLSS